MRSCRATWHSFPADRSRRLVEAARPIDVPIIGGLGTCPAKPPPPKVTRPPQITGALFKPPEDLDRNERTEFVSLIAGAAPSHFLPSRRSAHRWPMNTPSSPSDARDPKSILRACPQQPDRRQWPSPWLAVWVSKCRAMTTLSRTLSLSPGRSRADKLAELEAPLSYFQKLALEKAKWRT